MYRKEIDLRKIFKFTSTKNLIEILSCVKFLNFLKLIEKDFKIHIIV